MMYQETEVLNITNVITQWRYLKITIAKARKYLVKKLNLWLTTSMAAISIKLTSADDNMTK